MLSRHTNLKTFLFVVFFICTFLCFSTSLLSKCQFRSTNSIPETNSNGIQQVALPALINNINQERQLTRSPRRLVRRPFFEVYSFLGCSLRTVATLPDTKLYNVCWPQSTRVVQWREFIILADSEILIDFF